MLDVIARLEAAGMESSFAARENEVLFVGFGTPGTERDAPKLMCLVMTPDGGETEPQRQEPDQEDDGKRDEDAQGSTDI